MKWHKKPTEENKLSNVNPVLCKEWDVRNEYSPSVYAAGSGKKVWWRCSVCGNVWLAEIRSRNNGRGCPCCSRGMHVSKFEIRVYSEIKQYFNDAVHGDKINGIEIDVYIPSRSIGIEVDGNYWHQDVLKDFRKNEKLKKMGVTLIRLREDLPTICDLDIVYSKNDDKDVVLKKLLVRLGIDNTLKGEKLYNEMMVGFRRVSTDRMLSNTNPDLCLEWSKKNLPLMPNHVSKGSMDSVWWICSNGHEWKARIDSRVAGNGCPKCAGKTGMKLSELEITGEWSERNIVCPDSVSVSSVCKFWWYCKKHDYHYEKSPHDRYYLKAGCPICSGYKPLIQDSLASCLSIKSRWDYELNGLLKPEDLKKGSGRKVWLKGKDGKSSQFIAREVVKRKSDF